MAIFCVSQNDFDHFDLDHFDRHEDFLCKKVNELFVDRNANVVSLLCEIKRD